jgi:hypothetical protein
VRRSATLSVRGLAALLTITTALTLSAPPASAASAPQAPAKAPAKTSLAAATTAHLAVLTPAPSAFQETTPAATDSRGFFRTPTGVAALVLMVAGAGYVAVSIGRDNKKVHSPIR